MKRTEIKVGDKYAVVARVSKHARRYAVAATVLDTDASYIEPPTHSWGNRTGTPRTGGIRVRFDEPVVTEYNGFEPLAQLEERLNAGAHAAASERAVTEYVFPRDTAARHFLAAWDVVARERQVNAETQARHASEMQARAHDFAPVLDAYMAKLRAFGIDVALQNDKSAIYAVDRLVGLSVLLDVRRLDGNTYVVGFSRGRVTVDRELFDRLVGITVTS